VSVERSRRKNLHSLYALVRLPPSLKQLLTWDHYGSTVGGIGVEAAPLISACMIVRNESANLERCLRSLAGLVDEIVVVDTGSTDDTPTIASAFGARVFHEPWRNDFSFHRNSAIDQARGHWVYCIDADEEIVDTDFEATRYHLAHTALPPVLLIKEVLRYAGGAEASLLLPRLFLRQAGFRYVFAVHEQLNAPGALAALSNVTVVHHGYLSAGALRAKEARNLGIALSMPDSPHAFHCRARAAASLERWSVVIEAAERLSECAEAPVMASEACVLGGIAALRMGDVAQAKRFSSLVAAKAPDSPDMKLLQLLIAGQDYLDATAEAEGGADFVALRSPMVVHKRSPVLQMMDSLLSRTGHRQLDVGTSAAASREFVSEQGADTSTKQLP